MLRALCSAIAAFLGVDVGTVTLACTDAGPGRRRLAAETLSIRATIQVDGAQAAARLYNRLIAFIEQGTLVPGILKALPPGARAKVERISIT